MKQKKLFFAFGGAALLALLVCLVWYSQQSAEVEENPGLSSEDRLGHDASDSVEKVTEEQDDSGHTAQSGPVPAAVVPLKANWDSKPAPEADKVKLSAALKRSLAASASLREERYTNPNSELNLKQVETLRKARRKSHANKEQP